MSVTATSHGTRSSGSMGIEPFGFRLLSWGLFLSVLLILGLTSIRGGQSLPTSVGELILWVALVGSASLVPLTSKAGPALVMDLPILLGAGFVFGPMFAGLLGLVGCIDIRELRREVSISRALLNRAQISLSVMAAALVFHGLGGQLGVWPWAALVGLLALSADCAVNYTLVALATSLMSKRPARSVLSEMSLGSVRDLCSGVRLLWLSGRVAGRDIRAPRLSWRCGFRSTNHPGSSGFRSLAKIG